MTINLRAILRSNYVVRYHANPDLARFGDTNGHHQAMVAQIIMALHPNPSMLLIHAALHHDSGEAGLGDICGPAKDSDPELVALLEVAEARNRDRMGCNYVLGSEDAEWLQFADRLAAYFHVKHVAPHVFEEETWQEAKHWLSERAVAKKLYQLIWELGL